MNALLPLSWLYGAGVTILRRARLAPKLESGPAPRIVAIGNLEAGGNGKTPLAMWWLERAAEDGIPAAYVSRGYGAAPVSARVVTCVFRDDTAPAQLSGLRVLARTHPDLAREIGDEGALVVERVPRALAVFCTDKQLAVATAARLGARLVVLDDGFQSWSVPRHTDVVLLDSRAPLDGGQLLPAGRLREKPAALERADAIVFNGAATTAEVQSARERVRPWLRDGVPVAGMKRSLVLISARGEAGSAPSRVVAVCAIARPESFTRALAGAGVEVAATLSFRDHHRYTVADVERIAERAQRENATLVTTEKDWMKLRALDVPAPVWRARLEVSLFGDPLPV